MKITNKQNIPQALYNAICAKWYSGDEGTETQRDFSVTEMLDPIKIVILKKRHYDEIEIDASRLLWTVFGSAVHKMIEIGNEHDENIILEKRYKAKIFDKIISGGVDYYNKETREINDYKCTKVSSYIFKGNEKKWELQLNLYRYLMQTHNIPVEKLKIIEIFRDFEPRKLTQNSNYSYPPTDIYTLNMDIMSNDAIEDYIWEFIQTYEKNEKLPDDSIPVCSKDDRWQRGNDEYAVMKHGQEKAVKLFSSEKDAKEYKNKTNEPSNFYIQFRPAPCLRCEKYCDVNNFCNFYREYSKIKTHNLEEKNDSSVDSRKETISTIDNLFK